MLASELGVRAASEAFRDKPRLGGSNLDCAVNKVFKLGVEANDEGPRSRDKDGLERKALVDVAVVVVVVVEAIARAEDQIGSRLAAHPQRSGSLGSARAGTGSNLRLPCWFCNHEQLVPAFARTRLSMSGRLFTQEPHAWLLHHRATTRT